MSRWDRANPNARNFGLQSRDMTRAGQNALREGMKSGESIKTMSARFKQFAAFSKSEFNISDMRKLEKQHIEQYAAHLKESGLKAATAQNYLSAVNRVLEIARGDRHLHVAAVKDAGLQQRSHICTESKAASLNEHQQKLEQLPERLAVQIEMMRSFGLRFEESCKINAAKAFKEASQKSILTVISGAKGGLARVIPICNEKQLRTLHRASQIQGNNRSMIPADKTYAQYRNQCNREHRKVFGHSRFHGERHTYAQERYQQLANCKSPVAAGVSHKQHPDHIAQQLNISKDEAKAWDQSARLKLAEELGHGRTDITNNYLG